MKSNYIVLSILCLSFIFTQNVYDSYDIPEYEYRTFQLNGDELLNIRTAEDYTKTTLNIGSNYMSMYQSPGYNLSYGMNFVYDSMSEDDDGDKTDVSDWMMNLPFSTDKYFSDNKGTFAFVEGNLSMWGGDTYEDVDDTSDLPLTIGAGYGRIVSAKPIAQAYAIADALDIEADDSTILAIAAVIGSADSYESIYKDDATQQYYNDLAEASGVSGSAMQIQKVLTSPAYNVSDRFTGWDIRAGITNNYMQCDDCEDKGSMTLEANYAMPIDMDSQLTVSFGYNMDLNDQDDAVEYNSLIESLLGDLFGGDGYSYYVDGGGSSMALSGIYTKDHSYNWSTSASLTYISETASMTYYDETMEFSDNFMLLNVSSTKAILNQLSLTGSFTWGKLGGDSWEDSEPFSEISSKLTYWVF